MAAAIVSQSIIGVALGQTDTTAGFALGTTINLTDGGQAVYVKSSTSALSQYAAVIIDAAGVATAVNTTNAAANKRIGFAQVSIATSAYGWVQIGGVPKVLCAAQCAPAVPLFTTATSGVLDDATITMACVIGLVATTTISNATATTCIAAYPHIGGVPGS